MAKVAEEVAAAKAEGKKRRYATITIRENAFRRAHVEGTEYTKGTSKPKKQKVAAAPKVEEEEEEFFVEKLVDTRRVTNGKATGGREYHVKWYGYDDVEDYTWESTQNLNDALWDYDGFEEHVVPKLSKKEMDEVRLSSLFSCFPCVLPCVLLSFSLFFWTD